MSSNPTKDLGAETKQGRTRFFVVGVVALTLVSSLSIPFVFESQTLWYKVGIAKTYLLIAQTLGILAFISLIVQIFLGTRGKSLEEAFGVATLVAWHRTHGLLLCCLATLHMLFILVPEGLTNLPLGFKFWPEMVGFLVFLAIIVQVIFSLFRQQLGFNYKRWRMVHRFLGYLAFSLAAIHVLFVADSFAEGIPRMALALAVLSVVLLVGGVKLMKLRGKP